MTPRRSVKSFDVVGQSRIVGEDIGPFGHQLDEGPVIRQHQVLDAVGRDHQRFPAAKPAEPCGLAQLAGSQRARRRGEDRGTETGQPMAVDAAKARIIFGERGR